MFRAIVSLLIVLTLAVGAAPAVPAAARVEVQGDLVSATFDDTPAPEALDAVRLATGVEVVVPASLGSKTVTLAVERLPFEQFVRRLLQGLGLGGFALIYESDGAARRLIVVDQPRGGAPAADSQPGPQAGPTSQPAESGPVYIPPATPPVYIPPASPPVYIPPATPPVYVPPVEEPRPAPSQ